MSRRLLLGVSMLHRRELWKGLRGFPRPRLPSHGLGVVAELDHRPGMFGWRSLPPVADDLLIPLRKRASEPGETFSASMGAVRRVRARPPRSVSSASRSSSCGPEDFAGSVIVAPVRLCLASALLARASGSALWPDPRRVLSRLSQGIARRRSARRLHRPEWGRGLSVDAHRAASAWLPPSPGEPQRPLPGPAATLLPGGAPPAPAAAASTGGPDSVAAVRQHSGLDVL